MKTSIPTRLNQNFLNGIVGGFDNKSAKIILIRKMQPVVFSGSMASVFLDIIESMIRESHELSQDWVLPLSSDVNFCEQVVTRYFNNSFALVTFDGIKSLYVSSSQGSVFPVVYVLMFNKVREVEIVDELHKFVIEPTTIFLPRKC